MCISSVCIITMLRGKVHIASIVNQRIQHYVQLSTRINHGGELAHTNTTNYFAPTAP